MNDAGTRPLAPPSAPPGGGYPAVCPHCWMVNAGPFRLCGRCGADMGTFLQESGGLRRTAPVQSPVPVAGGGRLSPFQRVVVGVFVILLVLSYAVQLVSPAAGETSRSNPAPAPGGP